MKKLISYFMLFCLMTTSIISPYVSAQSTGAVSVGVSNVPREYYANPQLGDKWNTLLTTIVQMQALSSAGKDIDTKIFATLNSVFNDVLRYFPQTPQHQIVYEQCKITTADLAKKYDYNGFLTFKEKCLGPINSIVSQVQQGGSIKTQINALPKDGPAPLNVTFDARNSVDPSNDTIPSNNYYWYFKDINGIEQILGKGPIVNYTFKQPGNYVIHLTVRSVNSTTKGIFDGEASVSINVGPQVAKFGVYINGIKADPDDISRIGAQEALKGVLIDATATVPIGGRTIVKHNWKITGDNKFEIKDSGEGNPGQISAKFPRNGSYKCELEIIDNQGNSSKESYPITVSDPVAIIKYTPKENGSTSTSYAFDAGASYSLTSKLAKYQWTITDPNGLTIENVEAKDLKRKFIVPGRYNAKLTVIDEAGGTTFDSDKFYVKSSPPIASYNYRPYSPLKSPSQFVLDASSSFDEDVRQGSDALLYQWSFNPSDNVKVEKEIDGGKQMIITMNQAGSYKVKLTVTDQFGQSTDIDKDIKVDSTLRPELNISESNLRLGDIAHIQLNANKQIAMAEWDFGDATSYKGPEMNVEKEYKKSGIFNVKLKVYTTDGESNEINKQIFVGQRDMPNAVYEVTNQQNFILDADASCPDQNGVITSAFSINRYTPVNINAMKSTDTQGGTSKLKISMKAKNDEMQNKQTIIQQFQELGCQYVDIYAEDVETSKTDSKRVWFMVMNAKPHIDRLDLSFPQQASSSKTASTQGVGVPNNGENKKISITDILSDDKIDNVIVKLTAQGAKDPDGFLSHIIWYYYRLENPEKLIEAKITPGSVQFVNFSIPKPRQPGEFGFGVKLVDNDKGENTSEDILRGKGPSLFFPPSANNPDIPLVAIKSNKTVSKVGEEVKVTAEASILSNRSDFQDLRYFKFDFDGDGVYDLTSKNPEASRKYAKSGNYTPKVAVYYRERVGIGRGEEIQVQQGLQPVFEVVTFDKKILIKDFSIGDIENTDICLDLKLCAKEEQYKYSNKKVVFAEYPQYDTFKLTARITDKYGNSERFSKDITLTPSVESGFGILSIPQATKNDSGYTIALGNNIENTLNLYVSHNPKESCFIDTDITMDSDKDGDPSNDMDWTCNQLLTKQFFPKTKKQYAFIYASIDGTVTKTALTFEFMDLQKETPKEYIQIISQLDGLITQLEANNAGSSNGETGNNNQQYLMTLMVNLKESIGEKDQVDSILLQVNDLLSQNPSLLNQEQTQTRLQIFQQLSTSDVKASLGLGTYELNKQNILSRFDDDLAKQEVQEFFKEFEVNNGNKQAMKLALDKIGQKALAEMQAGNMDTLDLNYIKKGLCEIVVYYELPSKSCESEATTATTEKPAKEIKQTSSSSSSSSGSSWLSIIIKIILGIAGFLLLVFVIFFVIGVIKAKKAKANNGV